MRILIDYRPALRDRTGVGEYAHQMTRALLTSRPGTGGDERVVIWTSSLRDRPSPAVLRDLPGVEVVDRRIPVRWLNRAWHHLEWPPIEWLAGRVDVAHALHPLLLPARAAARVVTVHDLFFLDHPDDTWAEIRRDYPGLVASHVRRADAVITPSRYTAGLVEARLGVDPARITVVSPGAPAWTTLAPDRPLPPDGYLLFMGTLEPRKNVAGLLGAYGRLRAAHPDAPALVLAGRLTDEVRPALDALRGTALAPHVRHRGYVPAADREALYAGARALVLPSHDEGFGLPVLEAMAAGIPVIVSDRGALPEVTGDVAVARVAPDDGAGLADAMWRVVHDEAFAAERAAAGRRRAAAFSWTRSVEALRGAYARAVARRAGRER